MSDTTKTEAILARIEEQIVGLRADMKTQTIRLDDLLHPESGVYPKVLQNRTKISELEDEVDGLRARLWAAVSGLVILLLNMLFGNSGFNTLLERMMG